MEGSRGKSSLSDVATVTVHVTDLNDNAPVFGRGDYSAEVPEDLTPGGLVLKVRAQGDGGDAVSGFVHTGCTFKL